MRIRTGTILVAMVALATLVSTGCVTGKNFREGNEKTSARMNSAETGIEANERRISDLNRETDQALADVKSRADGAQSAGDRAMAQANEATSMAEKAARGKLLWSVTLSESNLKFEFGQSGICMYKYRQVSVFSKLCCDFDHLLDTVTAICSDYIGSGFG